MLGGKEVEAVDRRDYTGGHSLRLRAKCPWERDSDEYLYVLFINGVATSRTFPTLARGESHLASMGIKPLEGRRS